jgi:hypothetical protein
MNDQTFTIRFPESDKAKANMLARSLADHLTRDISSEQPVQISTQREDQRSQDFGATLVLVLGTAAVTAVAKGIQAWLKGHTGATMEITTAEGHVIVRNVESKSAEEIAKAFATSK